MSRFSQALKTLILTSLVFYLLLKLFIAPKVEDNDFQLSRTHLKFHSNWTSSYSKIRHIAQLEKALTLPSIQQIDISFAMSSLKYEDIKKIFPSQFRPYRKIKINLGSSDLGSSGVDYVLSLIPRTVQDLQLYFDSIKADNSLGKPLAERLNQFTSLKKLKLSLILCEMKDEGFADFFKHHKINNKLTDLRLVFVGNHLNSTAFENFGNYIGQNRTFNSFGINLYANNLHIQGAKHLATGLENMKVKDLDIDLYFNNITQTGTQHLTSKISQYKTLQKLSLNLDFNYINNEGGKSIGKMLKSLPALHELHIGVASKNFGYLGFKSVIDGMSNHKNIVALTLRCGVNRVGFNGVTIVNKMLQGMTNLQDLNIGFVENYIGDEGLGQITETVVSKLPKLRNLKLDLGFNDAKGYGAINAVKSLAKRSWENLQLGLSNNQFRDVDVRLMVPYIKTILKNSKSFTFEFMETAISRVVMKELQKIFDKNTDKAKIFVNSVIPENEQEEALKSLQKSKDQSKKVESQKPITNQNQKNIEKISKQGEKQKLKQQQKQYQQQQEQQDEEDQDEEQQEQRLRIQAKKKQLQKRKLEQQKTRKQQQNKKAQELKRAQDQKKQKQQAKKAQQIRKKEQQHKAEQKRKEEQQSKKNEQEKRLNKEKAQKQKEKRKAQLQKKAQEQKKRAEEEKKAKQAEEKKAKQAEEKKAKQAEEKRLKEEKAEKARRDEEKKRAQAQQLQKQKQVNVQKQKGKKKSKGKDKNQEL